MLTLILPKRAASPPPAFFFRDFTAMIICCFIAESINDQGRIVALADGDTDIGDVDFYAVLLVPVTDCPNPLCSADLNKDGVVDGLDLALLLGAWEPCGVTGNCLADFNCDAIVNGLDLAILLGQWGTCPSGFAGPMSEPESASASSGPPSLSDLIAVLITLGESDLIPILVEHWPGQ